MVAFTILASTILHGLTAGIVIDRVGARHGEEEPR